MTSCEVNFFGEHHWSSFTPLPDERFGLTALTIENRVLMTGVISKCFLIPINQPSIVLGGAHEDHSNHEDVYELDLDTEEWHNNMDLRLKVPRAYHGVSAVTEDLWQYCL